MNKIIKRLLCSLMFFIGCDNSNDDDANNDTNAVEVITHILMPQALRGSTMTFMLVLKLILLMYGICHSKWFSSLLGKQHTWCQVCSGRNSLRGGLQWYYFWWSRGHTWNVYVWLFSGSLVVQYSGPHEVLQYDMQVHRVSVKEPERVFIAYELDNHTTYAIQFMEYVSGVIAFKFKKF